MFNTSLRADSSHITYALFVFFCFFQFPIATINVFFKSLYCRIQIDSVLPLLSVQVVFFSQCESLFCSQYVVTKLSNICYNNYNILYTHPIYFKNETDDP